MINVMRQVLGCFTLRFRSLSVILMMILISTTSSQSAFAWRTPGCLCYATFISGMVGTSIGILGGLVGGAALWSVPIASALGHQEVALYVAAASCGTCSVCSPTFVLTSSLCPRSLDPSRISHGDAIAPPALEIPSNPEIPIVSNIDLNKFKGKTIYRYPSAKAAKFVKVVAHVPEAELGENREWEGIAQNLYKQWTCLGKQGANSDQHMEYSKARKAVCSKECSSKAIEELSEKCQEDGTCYACGKDLSAIKPLVSFHFVKKRKGNRPEGFSHASKR